MGHGGLLVMAEQQVTPLGQHCGGFCRPQLTAQPLQMGQGPHVPLPALPGDTLTFAEVCGEQGGHCKRQGGQLVPALYPWHPKPYSTRNPTAPKTLWHTQLCGHCPCPLGTPNLWGSPSSISPPSPGVPVGTGGCLWQRREKPGDLVTRLCPQGRRGQQLGPHLHPRDPQQNPATGSQQPPGDGVTREWGTGHAEDASQLQQRSGDAQREQRGPWPRLGLLQQSVGPQFLLGGAERPLLQASLQLCGSRTFPNGAGTDPARGAGGSWHRTSTSGRKGSRARHARMGAAGLGHPFPPPRTFSPGSPFGLVLPEVLAGSCRQRRAHMGACAPLGDTSPCTPGLSCLQHPGVRPALV